MKRKTAHLLNTIQNRFSGIINICLPLGAVVLAFYILEYSTCASWMPIRQQLRSYPVDILILNLLTLLVVWCLLYLVIYRVWLTTLCFSVLTGIIAIANYFVIMYHGMPLSFLLIRNFTTAMNVISGYQFDVDSYVRKMLAVIIFLVCACLVAKFLTKQHSGSLKRRCAVSTWITILCTVIIYLGYFGENPIKPPHKISFLWRDAYHDYGYAACSVETLYTFFHTVNKPEGYSDSAAEDIEILQDDKTDYSTPDLILILNESFCDFSQIEDLKTDKPILGGITSLDNVCIGYAVTPMNGGGTNCSEYELLTSNSLQLMPGITPFNMLDLRGANSVVSFLNQKGYNTVAAHCKTHENYNRKTGYGMLGFQDAHFEEDFSNLVGYGNRENALDESVYENLIRWYEAAPEDQPRFQYMLTYQNHANYERNDPQFDTVHAFNDFGEYDDQVDEYLTLIDLSDKAFVQLTEYFAQVKRPVAVCMVGDHTPSFMSALIDGTMDHEYAQLSGRKVPLIIWTNFEIDEQELGTMSMNYVVPTLLEIANVELSPYYQYQLNIKEHIPILTSYGSYFDQEGIRYYYDSDQGQKWESFVDNYFFLEYYNLQKTNAPDAQ